MTQAPVPVLPATTWICEGEETDLNVEVKADYVIWNTGEGARQIHISQPGTYSVTAFSNGCTGQASTEVKEAKLPVLSLPAQITACADEVIQLAPEHSADVSAFIWSDGSMANTLAVTESGHYAVQASNRCGVAEAETEVVIQALPALNLGDDRTLCREDQIVLSGPEGEFTYLWSDGSMARELKIQVPGVYRLTLENECGIVSDEVEVAGGNVAPPVPNVFTPNGDGINDQFIIREVDGQDFILNITDRWGQIAFSTKNPQEGWNGLMQNGGSAPEGAYFYSLRMRGCDGKLVESAGSLTLMR
jgi:gliding motility-associated-like protein